ncbi:MAG: hypothetical protein AABY68_04355 [Pseudomonadota bacterium]
MKIKKFRAVDSQQAMRQIRAEIGPDASILTCYQVPEGIEFVVAVDAPSLQQLPSAVAAAPVAVPAGTAPTRQKIDSAKDADMNTLRQELGSMRALLESHMQRLQPEPGESLRVSGMALNHLQQQGFSEQLQQRLNALLPDAMQGHAQEEDWRLALETSLADLDTATLPERGAVALVGTPGAGKTQLLATLAIRALAQGRRRHLHLISMDNQRFGAREQLLALGRALNTPVSFAVDAVALREQLAEIPGDTLVLIDTAGVDHHDQAGLNTLAAALSFAGVELRVLVLAADRQRNIQRQTLAAFAALDTAGLMLTWGDSLCLPGELASWLLQAQQTWFGASISRDATRAWLPADKNALITHTLQGLEFPAPLPAAAALKVATGEAVSRWRWNTRNMPA